MYKCARSMNTHTYTHTILHIVELCFIEEQMLRTTLDKRKGSLWKLINIQNTDQVGPG